jgi:uncharacterized protein (DUF1684 family)
VYIEIVRPRAFWAVLILGAAAACAAPEDYGSRIAAEREAKDEMFRQVGGPSPIRPGEVDKFVPLSYFPIDESYAVPAQLEPAADRVVITMPTSTGTLRQVERVGTLKFNLKGQPLKLTAFLEQGQRQLFVPFSDLTSGTETYQAGRYMNLDPTPSGIYIVDFNVAYTPYCYYNAEYECPLPPSENRLAIPIRAGERMRRADTTIDR